MTLFRHDCKKHGHRMEGRYDRRPGMVALMEVVDSVNIESMRGQLHDQVTYVKDVCVRCGFTVPR